MTNSTYTPSVHLFVDMDGTLVTWKQAACFEELLQEMHLWAGFYGCLVHHESERCRQR